MAWPESKGRPPSFAMGQSLNCYQAAADDVRKRLPPFTSGDVSSSNMGGIFSITPRKGFRFTTLKTLAVCTTFHRVEA